MVNSPDRPGVDPIGNNLDSVTPVPPPIEAVPRLSHVLRAGLVTGISAGLVCWLLFGIATLFGTDFDVRLWSGKGLVHVPWYEVLLVPLAAALLFSSIAAGLRRRSGCRRKTLLLGYALGALSLLAPLLQPSDVTWPTKIWLTLFHIVTIALVVPQVARVVGDSDPAVTAGYRRVRLAAAGGPGAAGLRTG